MDLYLHTRKNKFDRESLQQLSQNQSQFRSFVMA